MNRYTLVYTLLEQLPEWREPHPVYQVGNSLFHQVRRFAKEHDLWLVPRVQSPTCCNERQGGSGRVVGAEGADIDNLHHGKPPYLYLGEERGDTREQKRA